MTPEHQAHDEDAGDAIHNGLVHYDSDDGQYYFDAEEDEFSSASKFPPKLNEYSPTMDRSTHPKAIASEVKLKLAKRWRSEEGVTNFLGVHTDKRARNGDLGKNSSSSERGGGAGRKTSLGNERGTTSEMARRRGWGAKVVGNEREGRAKGDAASGSRLDWRGGWGTGGSGTSGRAADGAAGLRLVRSVVSRRVRGGGGAEVVTTGERGVGWVGARVDAGLVWQLVDGATGLRRRPSSVVLIRSLALGGVRD
ncbi:hypothetical protein THAOC_34517 [Thalassiosira oceanica]|uniref:Uncharacterized protein n=1 Tax=Thalassiosira oceanica TaxID=159749 RepID=K0R4U3_THAOC|nr:hypothetical protein THAOC_34517 [Thalassiosira oceanica]|eukprot:EJK46799.1 hypothetical protein THAOC_34517 [Thalassiosira oceanica]